MSVKMLMLLTCILACGCRVPMRERGISKDLIASRQLSQQGLSAMERRNWNEAERLLAEAVQTCAADPEARRHYAQALWQSGSRQEAMRQLEEAMRLLPTDASLRRQMAEFELALGNPGRAMTLAEEALDLDPRAAESWTTRAKTHKAAGDLSQALADYQRSLGIDPNQPEVQLKLAELHRAQNQPERALAALQSVREAYAPGEEPPQVYYLMGLASAAMGRPEDAVINYRLARERGVSSPDLLYQLAQSQWATGQAMEAEQTAAELLAQAPNHSAGQSLIQEIRTSRSHSGTLR